MSAIYAIKVSAPVFPCWLWGRHRDEGDWCWMWARKFSSHIQKASHWGAGTFRKQPTENPMTAQPNPHPAYVVSLMVPPARDGDLIHRLRTAHAGTPYEPFAREYADTLERHATELRELGAKLKAEGDK